MNQFLAQHLQVDGSVGGVPIGPETMGYYDRADLPVLLRAR